MKDNNKRNLLYFKANTMDKLHSEMDIWQKDNEKRFLSMSVEKDGDNFCCIALTNPSEVIIVSGKNNKQAKVYNHKLVVETGL